MSLRSLHLLTWIVLFLAAGELTLETRAWRHGWGTILFGSQRTLAAAGASRASPARYGPIPRFPFRSPVVPVARGARTLRVWVSSASMAEDLGLPPGRVFPSLLATELVQQGVPSQVLNASKSGILIRDNEMALHALGPTWKPDVVVLYQMNLDINELSGIYLGGTKGHVVAAEGGSGRAAAPRPNALVRWVERTTTFEALRAQVTPRVALNRPLSDDLPAAAVADFRRRVEDWLEAVRGIGAQPVLCTFATSRDLGHAPDIPADLALWMMRWNTYLAPDGWLRSVDRLNEVIREVARERGIPLVDAERAMAGRNEFFKDFVHFTPRGHARLADLIAATLRELRTPTAASPTPHARREG